ncbi:hypothetical protein [Halobaculum sp. D14]|uniref:hypothetical protein n=1 Tax=unclassified Halobaculum TaxID=2640896 RepID=UPI003EC086B9
MWDPEEDGPDYGWRGQTRAMFPVLALGAMLVAAASVAGIGGAVATGIGGEPIDRPEGFAFTVDTGGNDTAIVIRHPDGPVPSVDRVYVVDDAGTRVPWTELRTGNGTVTVTGRSALACPSQGATYRVVFDGRAATHTISAHEVNAPIPPSVVQRCEAAD